jgi:hypothetical protein
MIPSAWVEDYLMRSGDKSIVKEGTLIVNEHGFCSYVLEGEYLRIIQQYGDGEYWDKVLKNICAENNKSKIVMSTRRNPNAISRKYGYSLLAFIMLKEV